MLNKDAIILDVDVEDAVEAIQLSGELLVKIGLAKENYIQAMIDAFQSVGPYIVLAPGIAIPHARPENGALETGFSLVRLKKAIGFGHEKNDPVKIVCAITGVGNNGHIEMLQKIASILGDPNKIQAILEAKSNEEVQKIFEER